MGFLSGVTASSLLALISVTSALSIPDRANQSVNGVFELPLKKYSGSGPKGSSLRGTEPLPLTNIQENYYAAEIYVGSQKAPISVLLDTGSSDLIVGTDSYNPSDSSTSKNLHQTGEDWGTVFDFYTDDVTVSGATTNLEFGTSQGDFSLLGIGPLKGEVAPTYKNLPYALAANNYISKPAFSVYLENEDATNANIDANITNGVVLFGGIDHAKYVGDLASFPIISEYWAAIQLDTIKFADGSYYPVSQPVAIDTGTTTAAFPNALQVKINETFGPTFPNGTIIHYDESWAEKNFEFNFGSKVIEVPYTNFLTADGADGWEVAYFFDSGDSGLIVLGDIVIRNIYSVFDYQENTISIAQSAKNAYGTSNISAI